MISILFQVFLAVEVPLCVIVVLHMISSAWIDFLDYDYVKIVILINNLLISLSYPLNFGIYCGMSRQFRETFKELFIHSVTRRGSPSLQLVRFLTLVGSLASEFRGWSWKTHVGIPMLDIGIPTSEFQCPT